MGRIGKFERPFQEKLIYVNRTNAGGLGFAPLIDAAACRKRHKILEISL
jgi:hypothetical protein